MAASNADTAFGVDLLKGNADGPDETFTSFGVEIISISPPSISRSAIDVTHSASPNEFREFTEGIMDGGEVSLEINYIPSDTDVVMVALKAAKQNWQILLPNNIAWTFTGVMTAYAPNTPLDEKMSATVTFKVSGMPVLSDET